MRSILLGLVVGAVAFTSLAATRSEARFRGAKAEAGVEYEGFAVEGYGVTAAAARDRALEKAQERVRELLAEKLAAAPHAGDRVLGAETLAHFGVVKAEGDPAPVTLAGEDSLVARYRVRLNDDYLREAARAARQQVKGERHLAAARVLGGLVALLLVVTGYLRLEEATRGYATTALRAAAALILLAVGLGLWKTM